MLFGFIFDPTIVLKEWFHMISLAFTFLFLTVAKHVDNCVIFNKYSVCVICAVQTGGAIHVLPQTSCRHAAEDS